MNYLYNNNNINYYLLEELLIFSLFSLSYIIYLLISPKVLQNKNAYFLMPITYINIHAYTNVITPALYILGSGTFIEETSIFEKFKNSISQRYRVNQHEVVAEDNTRILDTTTTTTTDVVVANNIRKDTKDYYVDNDVNADEDIDHLLQLNFKLLEADENKKLIYLYYLTCKLLLNIKLYIYIY